MQKNIYSYVSGYLIFAFPLLFLFIDHWGSVINTVLALMVLFYARMPEGRGLSHDEKRLFIAVCLFLLSVLLTYIFVDQSDFNHSRLRRYARLFLIIPVIYVLLRAKPDVKYLWYGLAFGAVSTGILGLIEWLGYPHKPYRVEGDSNSIVFGDVSLVMACFCLAGWPYFQKQALKGRLLVGAGVLLALLACLLAGTRTAWLAAIAISLIGLWVYRHRLSALYCVLAAVLCVVVFIVLYAIPQTGLRSQLKAIHLDTQQYSEDQNIHSSLGARFEMWGVAIDIFRDKPVLGAGASEFKKRMVAGVEQGKYQEIYHYFSEPHSAYMHALSSRGMLGFVALLFLLWAALYPFARNLITTRSPSPVAVAGTVLVVSFAIFAVSASVFEMPRLLTFFGFYLAVLVSYLSHSAAAESVH